MFKRGLILPEQPKNSMFLWGPRQTGKTTLLKSRYPEAFRVDLLKSDLLMKYLQKPDLFREDISALPLSQLVIVDEVQKAPVLLDEIHYLIQEQNRVFILCGSSARKLRRGHANLLGGRAVRYELLGLTSDELDTDFNLGRFLNTGPIPNHYLHETPELALRSYVEDYLREEILQEGLVRRLPVFSDFLRVAAIGDTEVVNLSNIARESSVAFSTVRDYYSILVDTLLGSFLPAFTLRPKRRTQYAPKFYFRDVGVVNHLARRYRIEPGSDVFGKAFENWIFHELSAHSRYSNQHYDLSYWRLTTGVEVDFILGSAKTAIEVKGKQRITSNDLKGLRQFKIEYPNVSFRLVVGMENQARKTEDGIWIFPYSEFINKLWSGELT